MEPRMIAYQGMTPNVAAHVFIAPGACVIGDVTLGENTNVWYNTVLRGDVAAIYVGKFTNIQDNSTVHVMDGLATVIGDYVTIGHNAIVHGCKIGNNCLIGMGAIILNAAEIGDNCIIAAGSLIPERKKIPPNSLVMGSPGKVVRTLTDDDFQKIKQSALGYAALAAQYQEAP